MNRADLERDAGAGYRVAAYLLPTLEAPERARVIVTHCGRAVDAIDCTPEDVMTVWRHAAVYSRYYRQALTPNLTTDLAERIEEYACA